MVTTLDDTKRAAIASKLADMKAVQSLLISSEQALMTVCNDADVRERLNNMLNDDQKNMGILETVIVQYGVQGEPKQTTQEMTKMVQKLMEGSELSPYEKFAQFELLKHGQTMSGLLVHKAAQVVGADIEAAITPLNTVNFENRAHQEQLKGILEVLGVRELTGQEADQSIWARVQDAMAAVTGVAGSVISRTDDEMNIQDVIRMDHQKVNLLFGQIAATDNATKLQEYFGQLYKDLTVHAQAEEQVVYPAVRGFYGDRDTQELYDEQAEMKVMLDHIKSLSPTSPEFKQQIDRLKDVVMDHVRQEESTMFAAIRNNCSDEQKKQLATQFKSAKAQLQNQLATAQ
ncbi:MAG: hemerythrin domain-containing protein [Pegethrix bostrychoides GSE-TBD4-15B]|jgi:hemerythrin superfamily protein|uniref:Hemerythrin domain-containing protein n=1 Tax=Pegethrix bostrychoides GSE-TBD4-15B TaxID=2839662 RepID=A0A951P7B9_9CYAN|nr:hemerythrin domain-containing protein [Pegethrix bostrychoides GSE-TBD4-15B]